MNLFASSFCIFCREDIQYCSAEQQNMYSSEDKHTMSHSNVYKNPNPRPCITRKGALTAVGFLIVIQQALFNWFYNNGTYLESITTYPPIIQTALDDDSNDEEEEMIALQNLSKIASTSTNPPKTLAAFIHLGKTGGSTISSQLRNGCHSHTVEIWPCRNGTELPPSEESAISKLTTYYHVPDFALRNLEKNHKKHPYEVFILTLRDPFARAVSAFVYSHPFTRAAYKFEDYNKMYPDWRKNLGGDDASLLIDWIIKHTKEVSQDAKDFYSCFDNFVDAYAKQLKNFDDYEELPWREHFNHKDCASLAKSTLHHHETFNYKDNSAVVDHLYWDLRVILYQVRQNLIDKTILSIRQEYLELDWVSANLFLGDDEKNVSVDFKNHRIYNDMETGDTNRTSVSKELSDDGRESLCLALIDEYRLYLKLLVLSMNLEEKDVQQSLSLARKNCPMLHLKLPLINETVEVVLSKSNGIRWEL